MMEIGSEFSTNSVLKGQNEYISLVDYSKRYVLSGRTGLSLIAEELKKHDVTGVALPDYCCGTMIAPFVRQGLRVTFYEAFRLSEADIEDDVQAVVIMDYFGFLSEESIQFAVRCKAAGKYIIVDATQTAFSRAQTYRLADFIIVSYKKWFDCLGAAVYSRMGFAVPEGNKENRLYTDMWRNAAGIKTEYLKGMRCDKRSYLDLYSKANHELDSDYEGCRTNNSEINILHEADSVSLRKARRENAQFLIDEVKKLTLKFEVELIFDSMRTEDCPLFIPIMVNERSRSALRNELIRNDVYCPIHWPIDHRYPHRNTVYHQRELSLICDQRYGLEEMKRQIEVLSKAFEVVAKEAD